MDIYDQLGVRKIINGSATLTMLGGSLMPPAGAGGDGRGGAVLCQYR
jgi:hypothetical protein